MRTAAEMIAARMDEVRMEVQAARERNQRGLLSPLHVNRTLTEIDRLASEVATAIRNAGGRAA